MTDTPADYYRRKEKEAEFIIAQIRAHRRNHAGCDLLCYTRRRLEKALERARYVGD